MPVTHDLDFYSDIPVFTRFANVTDPRVYRLAPDSWSLVITDVRGSTKAIEAGRYKEINIIGVSSIIAVINALGSQKFPYVFGGDGATLLVPNSVLSTTVAALQATQTLAKAQFGFDLRVGVVPIKSLSEAGHSVFVARYQLSERTTLAMIKGSGPSIAEAWIKDESVNAKFLVTPNQSETADYTGLECRWQPLKSRRGEMLTLLVRATDSANESSIYQGVIETIQRILNGTGGPADTENLRARFPNYRGIRAEASVKNFGRPWPLRVGYFLGVNLIIGIGMLARRFGFKINGFSVRDYVDELVANTDFRKFDDMLRMVIDCKSEQREMIEAYLHEQLNSGRLVYGTHVSNEALMTCLVFNLDNHVHFLDGSDGGYAMAAKQLKLRWQERKAS